jgi:hypothetical protein
VLSRYAGLTRILFSFRKPFGLTDRFRQSVGRGQPQDPGARGSHGNSVPDGYKDGFGPVLGSQDATDGFALADWELLQPSLFDLRETFLTVRRSGNKTVLPVRFGVYSLRRRVAGCNVHRCVPSDAM